ncbi:biotin-dependent carboxyltransferase family protein [Sporosarcina sp. G11-34]|uniref:5-oxoprolinase subunit C family protein n=1 Tax=Sporosarcina sp. G11-34 TaxID=2849605 RepID=UPI0022A939BF|nr:biotin-dependent carboxyltransferase family protein [Sporosarcina sp. G11-34]MCZ2260535.1 biotin-dependent carboxyltransferase family protein [Sporosarcina sp. G11-34]
MIPLFRVVKPGVYATIQDRGRFCYRHFGMPVSGPMDWPAFKLGQEIMNNGEKGNALEIFLGGLTLEVLTDYRIIITGADLGARIDGEMAVPLWKTFSVWKGQFLSFPNPVSGSIAYIIPEGGYAATEILGSSSDYPRGLIGNSVTKDMILYANTEKQKWFNRGLVPKRIPDYSKEISIELFESPHIKLFEKASVKTFLNSTYTYRGGDRMGYFFNGPPLEFVSSGDIVSESTQFGTVQVPTNGQPIILMADAQTTGGYATLGTVSKNDLPKVAQLRSGGTIRFSYRK